MGQLIFGEIEREKILGFLKFEKTNVSNAGVVVFAIWNIINFCVAIVFVEYKILWGTLFLIMSGIIVSSLVYYFKKIEDSDENKEYFQGIYISVLIFSCGILACVLLKYSLQEDKYWIWLVMIIGVLTGEVTSVFTYRKNFKSDYYLNVTGTSMNSGNWLAPVAGGSVLGFHRIVEGVNLYLIMGILLLILSIVLSFANVKYFVKKYCYHLLEKAKMDSVISKEEILLVGMKRCNTCQRAAWWLEENKIPYTFRDIEKKKVGFYEIKNWHEKSDLSIERFFDVNVSSYKKMRLKEKLPKMTVEEQYELLVSSNTLLKHPIIIVGDIVLIGFKEYEWEEKLIIEKNK